MSTHQQMGSSGMNGTQPAPGDDRYSGMNARSEQVFTINWGFSAAQVYTFFGSLATLVTALVAGGYLFLPAKDSDLKALQSIVEVVRQEQTANRDAIGKLTLAVDRLSGLVNDVREDPPKVIERILPTPPRPAPKPR